ncbi:TPA: sulfate adenylyltransferase [Vibrio vulnificus]|nr:transglutaminase-like cysteine peptidase [Vibrio vulnificus]ELM6646826.1 transglutaminase-like cysteine peptidase [Vibrio vulnificus]MCG6288353.1 transglutaminase-like cysteine peptidase [Vibrio vulnificus]HAS6164752.1 sulfate adenylyltransferase [Vibrio vulnificus]HAS6177988.1 sulfate adenylyltransferase [Vibrio vulnificus]HAS6223061.1 sulfate adenylyltransferase [Vibrio vulnificus]
MPLKSKPHMARERWTRFTRATFHTGRWVLLAGLSMAGFYSQALNTTEQKWIAAVTATYGERAGQRVNTWRENIDFFKLLEENEKLEGINDFFNQLYFVDDIDLWGQKDYWATPLEFLGSNAGDCEDFTIAKYFSLIELGVSDSKLRLVYVKAIELNQFHMVLAYYKTPSSEPLILDNINPKIMKASKRPDLLPIYSFNGKNLWLMKSANANGQLAGDSSRLSLWNDLRSREKTLKLNKPIINYDE